MSQVALVRLQLLENGKAVVATCRSPQKADALHSLASSHQGRLTIVPMDVNEEASVQVIAAPGDIVYNTGRPQGRVV